MSYQLHSDEEKKLQRKLIPLNIVVALVALVAAISLIVTPLLKINFGTIASSFGSENSEGEGGESSDGGTAQYAVLFKNVDAEIVLSPLDMVKVLVAPAEEKRAILVNSWLIRNGVMEEVLVSFVNMSLVLATKEVQTEQLADIDLPKLNEALAKADEVQSRDELLTVLDGYLVLRELFGFSNGYAKRRFRLFRRVRKPACAGYGDFGYGSRALRIYVHIRCVQRAYMVYSVPVCVLPYVCKE